MEYMTRKNSKTAQILEKQLVSNKLTTSLANSKNNSEKKERLKESLQTDDSSPFSFFYSMIPKEILGIPVSEIKRDLNEMTSLTS
jgi:hypothetical protein